MENGSIVLAVSPNPDYNCPSYDICHVPNRHCKRLVPFRRIWCLILTMAHVPYRIREMNANDSLLTMIDIGDVFPGVTPSFLSPILAKRFISSSSIGSSEWGFIVHKTQYTTEYNATAVFLAFSPMLWAAIFATVVMLLLALLLVSLTRSQGDVPIVIRVQNIIWLVPSKQFKEGSRESRSTKILLLLYGFLFIFFVPLFRSNLLGQILLAKHGHKFESLDELILEAENGNIDIYTPMANTWYFLRLKKKLETRKIPWRILDKRSGKLIGYRGVESERVVIVAQRAIFERLSKRFKIFCEFEFIADANYPRENQVFLFHKNADSHILKRLNRAISQYKFATNLIYEDTSFGYRRVCDSQSTSNQIITLTKVWPWFMVLLVTYVIAVLVYLLGQILRLIQRSRRDNQGEIVGFQNDLCQMVAEIKRFEKAMDRVRHSIQPNKAPVQATQMITGIKGLKDNTFLSAQRKELTNVLEEMRTMFSDAEKDVVLSVHKINRISLNTDKYIKFRYQ